MDEQLGPSGPPVASRWAVESVAHLDAAPQQAWDAYLQLSRTLRWRSDSFELLCDPETGLTIGVVVHGSEPVQVVPVLLQTLEPGRRLVVSASFPDPMALRWTRSLELQPEGDGCRAVHRFELSGTAVEQAVASAGGDIGELLDAFTTVWRNECRVLPDDDLALVVGDEVVIHAPIAVVWEALADWRSYPRWNPYLVELTAPFVNGAIVDLTLRTGDDPVPWCFAVEVTESTPPVRLAWRGGVADRSRLSADHAVDLYELDAGTTAVRQQTRYAGTQVDVLMARHGTALHRDLHRSASALRDESERRYRAR